MHSPSPQPAPTSEPLRRQLGVLGLWLLAINGMIGAGIFGIPAEAERLAGAFSPWVFVLCALLIAPVMLCFAVLSSAFSGTGGPVLYVGTAFGRFAGFQAGWAFYIARLTAFAANLNLLVTTVGYFWPAAAGPALRIGLLVLVGGLLTWVNVVGARAAMASLGALTILKLLPLVVLAVIGLVQLDGGVLAAAVAPPAAVDLGAAVLLAIYAYVGFESSVVPAGEARDPQRDLPRALLWALLVAAGLYALVQSATRQLVPELAGVERPLVDAGAVLLGPVGAAIVVIGIIASVGANLIGSMFSTSRITYRLALDGQLPAWFARVHARHGTPHLSVIFYGAAGVLLAISGSFVWLAVLSVLVRLLLYLACIGAIPAVQRKLALTGVAMRVPGGPALVPLAALVCIGLLTQVSLAAVLATAGLLAVGSVLFALARWRTPRCAAATERIPCAHDRSAGAPVTGVRDAARARRGRAQRGNRSAGGRRTVDRRSDRAPRSATGFGASAGGRRQCPTAAPACAASGPAAGSDVRTGREGGDRLVARGALARGIPLIAPLPLPLDDYLADFESAESRAELHALLAHAQMVELPLAVGNTTQSVRGRGPARDRQYVQLGVYVSSHCQLLPALCDGKPGEAAGGIAATSTTGCWPKVFACSATGASPACRPHTGCASPTTASCRSRTSSWAGSGMRCAR